jgi:hypothetical protein
MGSTREVIQKQGGYTRIKPLGMGLYHRVFQFVPVPELLSRKDKSWNKAKS